MTGIRNEKMEPLPFVLCVLLKRFNGGKRTERFFACRVVCARYHKKISDPVRFSFVVNVRRSALMN